MYFLDTNIVSEVRRVRPHGAVLAWFRAVPDHDLFVAAVTVGEIQAGIEITRGQDAAAVRSWARLMHRQTNDPIEDAMIAATAEVHDLIVVTRNVRGFARLGVRTLNPFDTV